MHGADAAPGANVAVWRAPAALLNGVFGLALLAMAVWLWVGAFEIEGAGSGAASADRFPKAIALLLGFASLAVVLQAARSAFGGPRLPAILIRRPAAVGLTIVLVAIYPTALAYLHYYLATAVWMVPVLWLAGLRRPVAIVLTTAGFLLFTKVLFQMALGTPLP